MPKAYLKTFSRFARYFPIVFFLSLFITSLVRGQAHEIAPPVDIDTIINRLSDNYDKLRNFRCVLTKFEKLGVKSDVRVYKYSFAKPRLIRMDIIKGKNKGSVAVYKNGKVCARRGGIFKPFVITCELTDKKVTSMRGGTITESDWQSIVEKLKSYRKDNKLRSMGIQERGGRSAYLLAIDGIKEDGITARKLWIDASTFLPLGSETYEAKTLVNCMDYSDIAVNVKMPADLFNL